MKEFLDLVKEAQSHTPEENMAQRQRLQKIREEAERSGINTSTPEGIEKLCDLLYGDKNNE